MKKLLVATVFAAVAANSYQVQAVVPQHMPHGAMICRECKGDGRVRCGFLHMHSKRCLRCDGRGFLLPKPPPPPPKPHPVVVPHKPVVHKPTPPPKKPMPPKPMPVPPPKGGKGPR